MTPPQMPDCNPDAPASFAAPSGSVSSDADWGKALWDFIIKDLNECGLLLEIDTEELMQLAEKHGRARKVIFDPEIHGFVDSADPGDEIWWWGDVSPNAPDQPRLADRDNPMKP